MTPEIFKRMNSIQQAVWIEAKIQEAESKGFVEGVYFKSTAKINLTYTGQGPLTWNPLANSLWFSKSGGCVYDGYENTWATVITPALKKKEGDMKALKAIGLVVLAISAGAAIVGLVFLTALTVLK